MQINEMTVIVGEQPRTDEVVVYVYTKDGAVIGTKNVSIETEYTEEGKLIINAYFNGGKDNDTSTL